jgi:tetratricopeptide (TPR) repeat protein
MIYEAERYVKRALEIYPDYGSALHMQSGIAGEVYDTDHDLDKLLLTFKQALAQRDKLQLVDAKTKNTFADSYLEYLISKPAVQPKVLSFLKEIYPTFLEKKERTNALRYINYALIIAPQDPDLLAAKATATTLSEK